jgi:hypothetical protein
MPDEIDSNWPPPTPKSSDKLDSPTPEPSQTAGPQQPPPSPRGTEGKVRRTVRVPVAGLYDTKVIGSTRSRAARSSWSSALARSSVTPESGWEDRLLLPVAIVLWLGIVAVLIFASVWPLEWWP